MTLVMEFGKSDRENIERLVGRVYTISEQLKDMQERLDKLENPVVTTLEHVRGRVYQLKARDLARNLDIEA